jgi:hypothetical protein
MAKPTQNYDWATNTNYAGGPDTGTATKIEPPSGNRADGWRREDHPPAQMQNWWQNAIQKWAEYFEEVLDGARDPEITAIGLSRTRIVLAKAFDPGFSSGLALWDSSAGMGVRVSRANSSECILDLRTVPGIVHGTIITKLEAFVDPGAQRSGTNRMTLSFYTKSDYNWTTPGGMGLGTTSQAFDDGGASHPAQIITLTSGFPVTINKDNTYMVGLQSGNTGAASPDLFAALRITYTDAGPRNG